MKYHDFGCPRLDCAEIVFDVLVGEQEIPACPVHGDKMEIQYLPRGSRPFAEFDYEGDDGKTVRITSLEQIRKIERESMDRYRNGEGRPAVFRNYSQDSSNRNENVFAKLHPQYGRERVKTRNRRGVPFVTSVAGPPVAYEPDEE